MELQIELAQIIQCSQDGDAQNSLRSKQNGLQLSVKRDEGSLELGMKSSWFSVLFQYRCIS